MLKMKIVAAILSLVALSVNCETASARRWCSRSHGHTLYNSSSWHSGCYACHPRATKAQGWREALITLEKTKQEYSAFIVGLQTVAGTGQPSVQGYPVQNYSAEYSSYPVAGATAYRQGYGQGGVSAYSVNPLVDLGSLYNLHAKSVAQINASSHQAVTDQADLVAQESARQSAILRINAARDAIVAVAAGPPEPGKVEVFRTQGTTTFENGKQVNAEVSTETEMQASSDVVLDGFAILDSRCIHCHSGEGAFGGLDMNNIDIADIDEIMKRVDLPPTDPHFMPRKKEGDKFVADTPLTWKEKNAIYQALTSAAGQAKQ